MFAKLTLMQPRPSITIRSTTFTMRLITLPVQVVLAVEAVVLILPRPICQR